MTKREILRANVGLRGGTMLRVQTDVDTLLTAAATALLLPSQTDELSRVLFAAAFLHESDESRVLR